MSVNLTQRQERSRLWAAMAVGGRAVSDGTLGHTPLVQLRQAGQGVDGATRQGGGGGGGAGGLGAAWPAGAVLCRTGEAASTLPLAVRVHQRYSGQSVDGVTLQRAAGTRRCRRAAGDGLAAAAVLRIAGELAARLTAPLIEVSLARPLTRSVALTVDGGGYYGGRCGEKCAALTVLGGTSAERTLVVTPLVKRGVALPTTNRVTKVGGLLDERGGWRAGGRGHVDWTGAVHGGTVAQWTLLSTVQV